MNNSIHFIFLLLVISTLIPRCKGLYVPSILDTKYEKRHSAEMKLDDYVAKMAMANLHRCRRFACGLVDINRIGKKSNNNFELEEFIRVYPDRDQKR